MPGLEDLVRAATPDPPSKRDRTTRSVVFFDLVGSTVRKLKKGHKAGVMAAATHNRLCRTVVEHFGGEVLQELGDGVLAVFPDPLDAVLAAENVRSGLALYSDLATKVGMTFGMIDLVEVDERKDALGATVDRAARIQAAASPNEVLIDRAQADAIADYLKDSDAVRLGPPREVDLRSVGMTELRAIESRVADVGPPRLAERLRAFGSGRLPTADKLRMMNVATREVIEFGTGLTTFTNYFTNLNPELWRWPVRDLLARGVTLRCYAMDPDCAIAPIYHDARAEPKYPAQAQGALERLLKVRNEYREEGHGGFELWLYDTLPTFYALGVDLGEDHSGFQISPYLSGIPRAQCPVFEFSKAAEPGLAQRVQRSLEAQIAGARLVD